MRDRFLKSEIYKFFFFALLLLPFSYEDDSLKGKNRICMVYYYDDYKTGGTGAKWTLKWPATRKLKSHGARESSGDDTWW